MARNKTGTESQSARIEQALMDDIREGMCPVGSALPSERTLAKRFRTSRWPVQHAVDALVLQGYLEARHGSGVFVRDRSQEARMADHVPLYMDTRGHIMSELSRLLHDRLHDLGLFVTTLDMQHGRAEELLERNLRSDVRFLLLVGSAAFPYRLLTRRALAGKCVIAVLSWETDALLGHVHRLLVDHAAGGVALVDHLWAAGHRHILRVGPDNMMRSADQWDGQGTCPPRTNLQGAGFQGLWTRRGGRLTHLDCDHELPRAPCDEADLLEIVRSRSAPTAVVGMRDVDARDVLEILRRGYPEVLDRLTFVGNGDTPWSHTAYPLFTTLNWNLETIADLADGIIRDVQAGKTFKKPVVHLVPPRLVAR